MDIISGLTPSHDYTKVELIESGELTGNKIGLPRSAVGYYKLTRGMRIKSGADHAILDGAVVLQM